MANGIHTEYTFEQAIETALIETGGYIKLMGDDQMATIVKKEKLLLPW